MFKKYREEKGQSMVEFAIVLPILLILVCGIIDFGWLFYNQLALNNSAREGARYAVTHTAPVDRVTLITQKVNSVSPNSVKPITVSITYSNTSSPLLGDVTILLTSNIHVLTPLLGVFSANQQKQIKASVTMKVES